MYTRSLFIEQTRVQIKKQNLIFSNFPLEKQSLMTSSKTLPKTTYTEPCPRLTLSWEEKKMGTFWLQFQRRLYKQGFNLGHSISLLFEFCFSCKGKVANWRVSDYLVLLHPDKMDILQWATNLFLEVKHNKHLIRKVLQVISIS